MKKRQVCSLELDKHEVVEFRHLYPGKSISFLTVTVPYFFLRHLYDLTEKTFETFDLQVKGKNNVQSRDSIKVENTVVP
jgi:hypothetical protein